MDRFSRNEMLLHSVSELSERHVAVIGLGGVGSWCADALARAGIGHLTLVDHDTVGHSNVNRQLCARESTIGKFKSSIMADWVRDINPDINVCSLAIKYESGFFSIYNGFDFVVDAIDLVSYKIDLIKTAGDMGMPVISALATGNKLNPELLRVTDISETHDCPLARVVRKELRRLGILHHTVVYSPEAPLTPKSLGESPPPGRRSIPGSVPWLPASAGLLLASYVTQMLLTH